MEKLFNVATFKRNSSSKLAIYLKVMNDQSGSYLPEVTLVLVCN